MDPLSENSEVGNKLLLTYLLMYLLTHLSPLEKRFRNFVCSIKEKILLNYVIVKNIMRSIVSVQFLTMLLDNIIIIFIIITYYKLLYYADLNFLEYVWLGSS